MLAHEWAHLSGYAPEEDASFVGLLAALRADVPSQYSAWLFLVSESAGRLHPVTGRLVIDALGPGPKADLAAIAERLRARVPWLDRASWVAYDRAIKSQGAEEGVAGYGRVIDLVLGSGPAALPVRPEHEHALVVFDGAVVVDGETVGPGHLAYLGLGRDELHLSTSSPARALLIGGVPFPEQVLMWWNFVARTREEITAAHAAWITADGRFGEVDSRLPRTDVAPPPWASANG